MVSEQAPTYHVGVVTFDSHDAPPSLPACDWCGAVVHQDAVHSDLDVCTACGLHRVRSQRQAAAASRDDSIRAFVAEHLHLLQELGDVSDAWCAAEMAALDRVLGEG
jgi:acetyl-CoA carboxylase beta subunit